MDDIYITADQLGALREIYLTVPTNKRTENGIIYRQFKNIPQDKKTEMFISFEFRTDDMRDYDYTKKRYGYITRNETTKAFTDTLFQDEAFNQHIECYEWPTCFNCVVNDGIYISRRTFKMTKDEMYKLLARMVPAVERN